MWRTIDGTGFKVRAIGLGTMPLSIAGRPSPEQAAEVIRRFLALGGNFIDAANVYCLDDGEIGHNERLIARVLQQAGGAAKDVLVATKGGLRRPGGEWVVDGDPDWLRASCEKSLVALETDCIDLYQLHAVDPRVGLEASLNALVKMRDEGMIRHIGLSNVTTEQLRQALELAPIATVQNRCNLFEKQDLQGGLVEFCQSRGVSYIAHSPVGGHRGHLRLGQNAVLAELATRYGCSTYALALAWLLSKGEHIIPIPGASKVASIEDSWGALDLRLSADAVSAIDRLPDPS